MKNRSAFTVAAVVAAAICWSYPGRAGVFRQGASICNSEIAQSAGFRMNEDGRITNDGGSAIHVICPILSTTGMLHDQLTVLNVHGSDRTTSQQFGVKACTHRWDTAGLSCGTEWTSGISFTGDYVATPDRSSLQSHPADFPFLHVIIPTGSLVSSLRGFFGSAP